MVDIVTPDVRSRMMSGIRSRDTRPELILRHGLHRAGFRYRLSPKGIPGRPDLVFPMYRAVMFANGCFWHGHDCTLFKWPSTRREFWRQKITANKVRDADVQSRLFAAGWRVLTVWECAFKGPLRAKPGDVIKQCSTWLGSSQISMEIRGRR